VLLEQVGPGIYRDNPFRLLGLPVLAGPRDVAKRVDQLKLAAEFGVGDDVWSFGPGQVLPVEDVRAAAQALKEPAERLVQELFWFWSDNFPDDAGGDLALDHLARGETAAAVEIWQGAAMQGRLAGLHNLAIYYHLQALELEQQDSAPTEELIQLWFKALRFWEKISGDEELWSRLGDRVKRMADARVTAEFVDQMRATLPEALAKVCAVLALAHARLGRGDRAALHAALVTHIHGDTAGARRALEEYASPIARRIDARSVEGKNRLAQSTRAGLVEAIALLRHCDEDLRLIELLCGRTSDYYVEVSHGLVDAALSCVVAYQRETQDDFGCLPVLLHLLDMEASPELKRRVRETFDAIYGNALVGGSRAPMPAEGSEDETTMNETRAFQLIVDAILPGLDQLQLGEASRQLYAARAAVLLKDLGLAAGLERDDIELATRAFAAALTLPVSEDLRESLASDLAQMQRDFETRKEKELQVEGEGAQLIVNRHGICLNGCWVSPGDVAGLRHGLVPVPDGDAGAGAYVIAWRSYAGEEFELNAANLLPASPYVEEHYNRIVDSLYHFIAPGLIERLVAGVRAGHETFLGTMRLGPEGVRLQAAPARFWKKDEPISFAHLETKIEGGQLIVSSKVNPRQSETHNVANVWNAAVFGYVVEALSRS
jgi:hypothetical protein